jgi:hypothetical protein
VSSRDVVALGADLVGNHAEAHQQGERLAAQAQGEHRLQRGGDGQGTQHDPGGQRRVEDQRQRRRRHREHRADRLREALGGTGNRLRLQRQPGHDDPGDQLAERAERRPRRHPSREAVGDRQRQPFQIEDDRDQTQHDDATGDQAGRHLVDRIGEREQISHNPYIPSDE